MREICLNWNNHSSILESFRDFLSTGEMVDVTLACEGKSLKAHKVILAACSPFFQSLLSENPCKHPIMILTDVKYKELQAVIDFMYNGEINVSEEHLEPLIKAAEALKIKVLGDVTIAGSESEFHIGDGSEFHVGDEAESTVSDESKLPSAAVSVAPSDDESEMQSGAAVSRVQSDDESESQSGAVSRIQSEDESESQSGTVYKIQPDNELGSSAVDTFTYKPAGLTVTYSPCKRSRPLKRSRSYPSGGGASEREKKQPDPGTEVFGLLSASNLNGSTVSIKSQRTKSPKKQLVEESFAAESLEMTMPVLEEQMLIDEEVSINFQY